MRTIADIIEDWKVEYGTLKTGRNSQYVAIAFKQRKSLLLGLVQTMIDAGCAEEDISSVQTRNKVIEACTAPDQAPIPAKNIRLWKKMVAEDWAYAYKKHFHGAVAKYVVEEVEEVPFTKTETKSVENIEDILNPKDRLVSTQKIDRSADTNWELLAELGIDPDEVSK